MDNFYAVLTLCFCWVTAIMWGLLRRLDIACVCFIIGYISWGVLRNQRITK